MTFVEFMRKVDGREPPKPSPSTTPPGYYSGVVVISLSSCERVLDGHTDDLMSAFTWATTPQGSIYWDEIWRGLVELTEADRDFIRGLIVYSRGN